MRIFAKGDRVTQPQYGCGTVSDANDRHTIIDFDEHGLRTFSTPLVRLERSTTPAPARMTTARKKRTRKTAEA